MNFFSSNQFRICALLLLATCPAWSTDEIPTNQPANVKIDFDRDIQPILATSCIRCHGPEKPRSHFRLNNRADALKGGDENTNDIVPGDSSKSLLINYVARQVPDMEMPPVGKGDSLTPQQTALLRAWIDQGAEWSTTNQLPQPALTFAPMLRWIDVQGNQSKFRELEGVNPGFSGGAEEFSFTQQTSPDEKVSVTGHVIVPNQDIEVKLAVDKTDRGFIHAGFDEWRTYYNDVGGYDPIVTPPEFSLNQDLYVNNGDAWIDFGLTLPHQPQVVLGYEYQFQNGNKSMLDWGSVSVSNPNAPGVFQKNIYPAMQAVDEHTHIIKLDVTHEFDDWHVADNARFEFYSANNLGVESEILTPGGTSPGAFINTQDKYQSTQGMNTLMLEKQIYDWWFLSSGFYYSKLEGSDFFNQTFTTPGFNNSLASQQITLNRESEIFSVASLFTPLTHLTFSLGTQNEWTTQSGFGNSVPDFDPLPMGTEAPNAPVGSNSELFKASQNTSLRYTKIPFTVLFADGRFDQETVSQFQQQDPDGPINTETQTDATNYRYNFSTGFNTSPWRWCSLNAQYQYQYSDSDYNYPIDAVDGFSGTGNGYPGFILNRKIKTDGFETKLDLRPANWVKTTLSYKIAGTDYSSITDPAFFPPGSTQLVSPGGPIMDGTFNTQTYGLSATLTPIQRLYLYNSFTFTHSRAVTANNDDPSIVPYSGDIYTLTTTATYALNPKTSLQASYIFSYANYGQGNAVSGLPLGLDFTRDEVIIGLTRQLTTRLSCALHYEFSKYNEPSSGNANNFTAQGVFATLVYKWQ
jgi:Planctomycete cytochrome C